MTFPAAAPVIAAALARALAPRKPLTVSQWADLERRLSSKGSAEPGRWRTDRNPPLREPMDCLSARSTVKDIVLMFPIQFGKALALDTPLPAPTGWTTMGEVSVGDMVFGADGVAARVVAVSEVFDDHPCYRLTFSDGAQVVADAGHRWSVIDLAARNEAQHTLARREKEARRANAGRRHVSAEIEAHRIVLETADLAKTCKQRNGQARYGVMLAMAVDLPPADLPIDPYLLGAWLGDGHTHYGAITTMDPEIIAEFQAFDPKPHKHQSSGKATTYGLRNGFSRLLRLAGVLQNKHIPTQYLRASVAQRLSLLQGLMDTDGHAGSRGRAEITSSKPALVDGIIELLHSLGFKPSIRWRKTKGADSARITFPAFADSEIFKLPRKRQALLPGPSKRGANLVAMRHIVSIEQVPTVPTRCIAVDSADHLFLCGREFIPTHNTEVALNALGYTMDHHPGPVMVCLPGEVSSHKWSAQKLGPMLEESPAVRATLASIASRDGANRREFKDFSGGQLYLEHAGSPARLKSTSVRTLIVDELDEFAANLVGGDDPVALLEGRTSAFPSAYKRLYISTPQVRGTSRIEALWEKSDQRRYHVPCPHCGEEQPLEWSGLRWGPRASLEAGGGVTGVAYVCRECGVLIDEHHKPAMIAAGRWIATNPGARTRGYHINCLYYPIGLGPRWADLVEMWLDAQNDPAKLKTFINDRLAEPWEDPAMRAVKHNVIADRAEPYPLRTAPAGVLVVTAGIDTQDNRLAVQVEGWGRGLRSWTLDYVELPGDPAEEGVWQALVEYLARGVLHESGVTLDIQASAIDAGGHRTEAVKAFVRARRIRRPLCIFGAVPNNAPVLSKGKHQDVNWKGQYDKRGVMIHHVGTVAIKHWLYGRLSADAEKAPEDRLVHFSDQLAPEYFAGLVSESYNPSKNRFEKKRGARNEPLDTWVYSHAAAHHPELRLHRYTAADWQAVEDMIHKKAAALRADPSAAGQVAPAPSVPEPAPQAPRIRRLGRIGRLR